MNKCVKNSKKFNNAVKLLQHGEIDKAEKVLKALLQLEPEALDIKSNLAYIDFKRGNFLNSYNLYKEVIERTPNDVSALNRLAAAAMHIEKYGDAEEALLKSVALAPEFIDSWINLCALSGFQGDDIKGLHYAMEALALNPTSAGAYVNLGSCLQMCNRLDEARIAFETAITLDPNQLGALINLGVIEARLGNDEKAIDYFDQVISRRGESHLSKEKEAKFYKSISLLNLGRLQEAWALYDNGFFPSLTHGRSPKRNFPVKQWSGEKLTDLDTLLCWKEQGVGDELLFLSCLPQISSLVPNLIVECDGRLVSGLRRSFPKITFREAVFFNDASHSPVHDDFTHHIPIGTLFGMMRPNLQSFEQAGPIIKPIPELVERFCRRLNRGDGRLKVGICWRSGSLSATRNTSYTSLSDWQPIFNLGSDVDFYNLQYGDFQQEITNANEHFGIHINWWPDIDYKNSFEDLFALVASLDMVITVGTAVSTIAASVGTPTLLMVTRNWTSFGTNRFLAYPDVTLLMAPPGKPVNELIPSAANLIEKTIDLKGQRRNMVADYSSS